MTNDMNGRNDVRDKIQHSRDCVSLQYGNLTAARHVRFAMLLSWKSRQRSVDEI